MYFKIGGPDCEGCGVYYFSDQPISQKLAHSFLFMVFQWFSMVYPLLYETSRSSMKNYKQPNGSCDFYGATYCHMPGYVVNVHDISSRTSATFSVTTGSLGIASIGSIAFCHCWKYEVRLAPCHPKLKWMVHPNKIQHIQHDSCAGVFLKRQATDLELQKPTDANSQLSTTCIESPWLGSQISCLCFVQVIQ